MALNSGSEAVHVELDLSGSGWVEGVKAYLTDNEHEMQEVEVSWGEGGVVSAEVTPRGLITFRAS